MSEISKNDEAKNRFNNSKPDESEMGEERRG
jgi:hypothetical protein